jgi:site-specific recombinase XerD
MSYTQVPTNQLLSGLPWSSQVQAQGTGVEAQRQAWRAATEEGRNSMNRQEPGLQEAVIVSRDETLLTRDSVQTATPQQAEGKLHSQKERKAEKGNQRGVFERVSRSGVRSCWIRYFDAQGRLRREKAGTKGMAIDLYRKRKMQALEGKKLPERLRRATVTFASIAKEALAYSKVHKAGTSYRCDAGRMEVLLGWFREYPAESITAQDIERRFQKKEWAPATTNRYRALLSLTYRLAIRNGSVKENPARLVPHRLEDNARIRFLSADEETALRKAIEGSWPERMPEFDLALNTGLRLSEQYGLLWENVSISLRMLTIPRSKNGTMRHVPLNQAAVKALETLRKRSPVSDCVCGGAREPRRWFEPVLKDAQIANFSWHCLRHTFASRLIMAGVDIRTVQELLGHKTIAMTVRYSHLAPKHTLAAVERLDARTEVPTDTTTDTGLLQQNAVQMVVLQ